MTAPINYGHPVRYTGLALASDGPLLLLSFEPGNGAGVIGLIDPGSDPPTWIGGGLVMDGVWGASGLASVPRMENGQPVPGYSELYFSVGCSVQHVTLINGTLGEWDPTTSLIAGTALTDCGDNSNEPVKDPHVAPVRATEVKLNWPNDLDFSPLSMAGGNLLFITDALNRRVLMLNVSTNDVQLPGGLTLGQGQVVTVAGGGYGHAPYGQIGGPATNLSLCSPGAATMIDSVLAFTDNCNWPNPDRAGIILSDVPLQAAHPDGSAWTAFAGHNYRQMLHGEFLSAPTEALDGLKLSGSLGLAYGGPASDRALYVSDFVNGGIYRIGETDECATKNENDPCDDHDACTTGERCVKGHCVLPDIVVSCSALDQCHEAGTCDPGTGVCSTPPKSNYTPCESWDPCATQSACLGGACVTIASQCATSWSSPNEIPPGLDGATHADAAVTFNNEVYLLGVGAADNLVYVNHGNPVTHTWHGWTAIPWNGAGQKALTSVAAVVYSGKLYAFWVDYDSHFIVWASSADGTNWVREHYGLPISVSRTSSMISATVWYGRIYVFFKSEETDSRHFYVMSNWSANGVAWNQALEVQPPATTPHADTSTTYSDRLWLFSLGSDGTHWYNNFDGYNWYGWTRVDGSGTSAVATKAITYNNRLHLFAIGADQQHHVNVYDGSSWSGWYRIPALVSSSVSDTATVFADRLWLFSIGATLGGTHHYASCASDVGCGGGTDNGDAILYSGTDCTGSSRKLTASGWDIRSGWDIHQDPWQGSVKLDLSAPTGGTVPSFPDGTPAYRMRCVWVRPGYRLTLCNSPNLGGVPDGGFPNGACADYVGSGQTHHAVSSDKYSLGLVKIPNPLWGGQTPWSAGQSGCSYYDTDADVWNQSFQSITHSDTHIYVARAKDDWPHGGGRIRRYPITSSPGDFCVGDGDADFELGDQHPGGMIYYRHPGKPGYLWATVYGLTAFDADLNPVAPNLPAVGDWIAINPVDGLLYAGSMGGPTVSIYQITWDQNNPALPTDRVFLHSFNLNDFYPLPPTPETLNCIQGAVFSPQGFLYLASDGSSSGIPSCGQNSQGAGVYVFSLFGGPSGLGAAFEGRIQIPAEDSDHETETIDLWDTNLRNDVTPWSGRGQIHYGVRLNGRSWEGVNFYHYAVPPWTF